MSVDADRKLSRAGIVTSIHGERTGAHPRISRTPSDLELCAAS